MPEALIIAVAAFAGALTQRTIGFGVPFFLVPVLLIYFDPPVAIVTFLLVASFSNLLVVFAHRDKKEIVWPVVLRVFAAAIPGLILGAYVVTHIDKSLLQVIAGVLIIVSICIQEFAFPKPSSPLKVSRGISISGFVAGILNTAVGISATALILWFRTHVCRPNQIRHNLAIIFLLMNVVSFASIYLSEPDSLTLEPVRTFVWLLPVVIIGNFTGQIIARRINTKQFEKGVFVAVIATGVLSMALGLNSLL